MDRLFGIFLICISAASFGAMAIFARLAYAAGADPITVLFLRFSIAGIFMACAMIVKRLTFPKGQSLIMLILMGGIGYVGQSFCYFTALTMVSAGLVAILLYLYPTFVTILSAILLKSPITKLKITALAFSLTGTFLIIGVDGGGKLLGIFLAVIAPVIYSFYIITGSKIVSMAGAFPSSAVVMISAAVVFSGVIALKVPSFPTSLTGWVSIFAIALISTVLAIVTFFAGLRRLDPSTASMISTMEPVVTVALASAILGEEITFLKSAGGLMVLAAVLLLSRGESKKTLGGHA